MIRVTCPHCNSRLNAKDELAGQTRQCPNCAQPVHIVADDTALDNIAVDPTLANQHVQPAMEDHLPSLRLLDRLSRDAHYLICNQAHLIAKWEANGQGWMLKSSAGFISAKRNREQLPTQGDFKLIELKFSLTPDGKRLTGLTSYQLAPRWALTVLDQGDDEIAAKIAGFGGLNRDQKNAVRQALKDHFMRQVWQDAAPILEYLGNADFHSHSVA